MIELFFVQVLSCRSSGHYLRDRNQPDQEVRQKFGEETG